MTKAGTAERATARQDFGKHRHEAGAADQTGTGVLTGQ
jgi:hypothetical protein